MTTSGESEIAKKKAERIPTTRRSVRKNVLLVGRAAMNIKNPAGMNEPKEMANRPQRVGWPSWLIAINRDRLHRAVPRVKSPKYQDVSREICLRTTKMPSRTVLMKVAMCVNKMKFILDQNMHHGDDRDAVIIPWLANRRPAHSEKYAVQALRVWGTQTNREAILSLPGVGELEHV